MTSKYFSVSRKNRLRNSSPLKRIKSKKVSPRTNRNYHKSTNRSLRNNGAKKIGLKKMGKNKILIEEDKRYQSNYKEHNLKKGIRVKLDKNLIKIIENRKNYVVKQLMKHHNGGGLLNGNHPLSLNQRIYMNFSFDYGIRDIKYLSRYMVSDVDYKYISFNCKDLLNQGMIDSINDWQYGSSLNPEVKRLMEEVIENNIKLFIGRNLKEELNMESQGEYLKTTITNNGGHEINRVHIKESDRSIKDNTGSVRLVFSIHNTRGVSISNREVYVAFSKHSNVNLGYIKECNL